MFLSIKHFRHVLEGRSFAVFTDHKPLCGALTSLADRSPRQTRHLSFIAEFTSSSRHVAGPANVVVDALIHRRRSRLGRGTWVAILGIGPTFTLSGVLIIDQTPSCSLTLSGASLLCDVSTTPPLPVIPASMVSDAFACVHGLAHQGSNATLWDAKRRFLWHSMSKIFLFRTGDLIS